MVVLEAGKSLYDALGVAKDASAAELRKAYLKLAVQLHPDKNADSPDATERFQTLQKVYAILSDAERRKVYDRTGSVDDSEQMSGEQFDSLYAFYRDLYAPVTEEDLDRAFAEFRGSPAERADVLRYYRRFEGDMGKLFMFVMCSDAERDSHRFMDIVDAGIEAGEVERYKRYTAWAKRTAKQPRPADPLAPLPKAKKPGKEGTDSQAALVAQIRGRAGTKFDEMVEHLTKTYAAGKKPGSRARRSAEPSEEEFEAARARLDARRAGAAGGSGSGGAKREGAQPLNASDKKGKKAKR